MRSFPFTPLIIIGAPRSGTNMLRDALTYFSGVATWPCDEINYIWRRGNATHPSDAFDPEMARPAVRRYIRGRFEWVARRYNADVVVEKTCANSLRGYFVDRVVPEAKYVFIRRDGLDALESAMKRWQAAFEPVYILRKIRFVPLADAPFYAKRFLDGRLQSLLYRQARLSAWGPRLENMSDIIAARPLDETCALQWKSCVDAAAGFFANMPDARYCEVSYESLVKNPEAELQRLLNFAGINHSVAAHPESVAGISSASIGKGRQALGEDTATRLMPLIKDTMARYGYA